MSIQNFEKLFEEYGNHFDNIASKNFKNQYKMGPLNLLKVRDPFTNRNNRKFLMKLNKKVMGRSFKVYQQVRKLYQF